MPTCTRRFTFDSGHRVLRHESKCAGLHGHTFIAEITCYAKELDSVGRVIDFSKIKAEVGGWIDKWWDHKMILCVQDPLLEIWTADQVGKSDIFKGKAPYVMQDNPTSENLAKHLYWIANNILRDYNITCSHVRLFETPNCWSDYGGEEARGL